MTFIFVIFDILENNLGKNIFHFYGNKLKYFKLFVSIKINK